MHTANTSTARLDWSDVDMVGSTLTGCVLLALGGGCFAVAMDAVAEVGRLPSVTRVPDVPSWFVGVSNWRGRILGVVDLRPLLGGRTAGDSDDDGSHAERDRRLVLLASGALRVGLAVDAVLGVGDIDLDRLEPVLATLPGTAARLLRGQLTSDGGPLGVLDPDAILALRRSLGGGTGTYQGPEVHRRGLGSDQA